MSFFRHNAQEEISRTGNLSEKKFQSNYRKLQVDSIQIELSPGRVVPLNNVLSVRAKEINAETPSSLFYIYTTADNMANRPTIGADFIGFVHKHYSG